MLFEVNQSKHVINLAPERLKYEPVRSNVTFTELYAFGNKPNNVRPQKGLKTLNLPQTNI